METTKSGIQNQTQQPKGQIIHYGSRTASVKKGTGLVTRQYGLNAEYRKEVREKSSPRAKAEVRSVEEPNGDAKMKLQESFNKGWSKIAAIIENYEEKYGATTNKWTANKEGQPWRRVALRGLFASMFGLLMLCWRGIPITLLVLISGFYALGERKWELIVSALVGFCVGLFIVVWPGLTTLALLYLVAGVVAAAGGLMVLHAIRLRTQLRSRALAILDGCMLFAFGAMLSSLPLSGASAITWVMGMYALGLGLLLGILAFRMRRRPSAS